MIGGKALELLAPDAGMSADLSRCLHRRFSGTSCRRCAQACPSGALTIDMGPRIDPAPCTACRSCEAACPTGALSGDERNIGRLATELAEMPRPVLGCRVAELQAHVRTGCLGFLETEGLVALALLFPEGITLNLTRCGECPNAHMLSRLEHAQGVIHQLHLGHCAGHIHLARSPEELEYREAGFSRREFFSFLRKRSADAAGHAATRLLSVTEPANGRRKTLPPRRRLLLRALSLLTPEERPKVEAQLFPSRSFGSTCTGCTGCIGICPTGAIATGSGDPPRPVFTPCLCTDCLLCVEFCRKGAIKAESS